MSSRGLPVTGEGGGELDLNTIKTMGHVKCMCKMLYRILPNKGTGPVSKVTFDIVG